jgi:hypothetical protein
MKKFALLLVALFAVTLMTGCVAPFGAPVYGGLITSDVKGPIAVGDPTAQCTKEGKAEATGIILFASGDASIDAAMKEGGITKIHHVDCKVFSVLGLYTKWETIVYGE